MAVTGPIFQRAQSTISALHVHTIIIFSASRDLSGVRNEIINSGYQLWWSQINSPHPSPKILLKCSFGSRKENRSFRPGWHEIWLVTLWCFALMLHFVTYVWRLNGRSIRQAVNVSQPLSLSALQTGKMLQPSRNDLARLQPPLLMYGCTRSWSLLMPGLYQLFNCLFICLSKTYTSWWLGQCGHHRDYTIVYSSPEVSWFQAL